MGRTERSFRVCLDQETQEWRRFAKGLRREDKEHLEELVFMARKHADAGSLSAKPIPSEAMFLSVLLEQQKMIKKLQRIVVSAGKPVRGEGKDEQKAEEKKREK